VTRGIRCIAAFVIAWSLQAGVSFAEANWWDHASGPGGFWGLYIDYRFACIAKKDTGSQLVWLDPGDRTALPSLWPRKVDSGRPAAATAEELASLGCRRDQKVLGYLQVTERIDFNFLHHNRLVPDGDGPTCQPIGHCDDLRPVRVWSHEIGYVHRLPRGFAVGAAAGINRFAGRAFEPFYRLSFVPTIEWDPSARSSTSTSAHWLKLVVGPTVMFKGFTNSDFCNRPGFACEVLTPWQSDKPDIIHYRASIVVDISLRGRDPDIQ